MDGITTPDEHPVKRDDPARWLDEVAGRAAADPSAALELLPWLGASIDADAAARRFAGWGLSTVLDENTGTAVIPASVFDALHARAGLTARFPVGNAGLLHVYGYLLSNAPTPYGRKRQRWLDGALAHAYGLETDAFLPWAPPTAGTLLARVTSAARALLATSTVREERIGETGTRIAIDRRVASGPAALAYALTSGDETRLVTTFPVASRDELLASIDAEGPRLRWNAVG